MSVDFILPSFPPLPDGMWIATSAMLDASISKCMKLLGGFVTLKMIHDWYESYEEMNISMHIRTLFRALMMVMFFRYYKSLLMFFDYFIDTLALHDNGYELVFNKLQGQGEAYKPFGGGFLRSIWRAWRMLADLAMQIVVLFTHKGLIYFMHYIRAVSMLLLVQLGPMAAVLSWLPGPFSRAFQQWSKSYVTVSCWAITLQVFWVLSQGFGAGVMTTDILEGPGARMGYILLSIALAFAILMTPSWTAKFIGGDMLGGFASGLRGWVARAGQLAMKKVPISALTKGIK
ncbi:MAG: hypothetical protein AAF963_02375 [Bacteroidota bacterium]